MSSRFISKCRYAVFVSPYFPFCLLALQVRLNDWVMSVRDKYPGLLIGPPQLREWDNLVNQDMHRVYEDRLQGIREEIVWTDEDRFVFRILQIVLINILLTLLYHPSLALIWHLSRLAIQARYEL